MERLALLGGQPVRSAPLPQYRTIGEEEKQAVMAVLDSGVLSQFLGTWSMDFYGGQRVQALERAWEAFFGTAHAVSLNSATSGLFAAVGAAGVGPGDEVIVSPYTMSASAVAAVVYGGIPVFADIDPDHFCLTPATIRPLITPRTRAIIVVDLFGYPADIPAIVALAREHGIVVIEDNAQGPGARRDGRYAGSRADMAVFSLNYHKTIHSGEGGVVTTDDARLAERLQLIRNHAEVVVQQKSPDIAAEELVNLVGYNYRMTEIEAAIAAEQLKKLPALVAARQANAARLAAAIEGLPGLTPPRPGAEVEHGWYVFPFKYDAAATGVPRAKVAAALRAEGFPVGEGYVKPLYTQPIYRKGIALGRDGFPFAQARAAGTLPDYGSALCPVTERMHAAELLTGDFCHAGWSTADLDQLIAAFRKVFGQLDALREAA
ncbi:DegT/DnrJ/EryC1/StrS family aminotransferase [Chitinimonas koreensis]|uniref:DegT/DnrJ/EryC1/StrS family aminotransferase n=1 Tax=Chitinimonas koreensis TaxID=356302 RepID=UPI0004169673|nr:DegT/DnrJ/EryC1/StrS family aminotransferase [Chitinimonas koreensis]QNM98500.1 DegT/DnrJ/EryC1/StrS family aminotransferase [Chitinimonas koreensis]